MSNIGSCDCYVLYCEDSTRIKVNRWIEEMQVVMYSLGVRIDTFSVEQPGALDKPQKVNGIAEIHPIVSSSATSIELFDTIPGYQQLSFGWKSYASLNQEDGIALLCIDKTLGLTTKIAPEEFFAQMTCCIDYTYGIYYRREYSKAPDFYALGIVAGLDSDGKDMAESQSIAAWANLRMDSLTLGNIFREAYEVSALRHGYLHLSIDNMLLADWIAECSDVGHMSMLRDDVALWSIPQDKLSSVHCIMRDKNMLP